VVVWESLRSEGGWWGLTTEDTESTEEEIGRGFFGVGRLLALTTEDTEEGRRGKKINLKWRFLLARAERVSMIG